MRLLALPLWLRWFVWILYAAAWTTALLMPVPEMPAETGLGQPAIKFWFSKTVHLSAYALFAVLTAWLHAPGYYRFVMLGVLPGHAAMTEFLQWLLPTGRHGCIEDVCLDLVGISIGVALSWKWWRASLTPGSAPAPAASPAPPGPGPYPPASATTR